MTRKFTPLLETYLQKFTRGGFLTGDIVKIKKDAFSSDFFKSQPKQYQEKLKSWAQSDLLLRVSAVKPIRPTTQATGNAEITGSEFDVDITQEIAPGRYVDYLTIPASLLDPLDATSPNLPPIPDSLKRKSKTNIKPEEQETQVQQVNHTFMSDDGKGKLIHGDRKLNNVNTKIPSMPATKSQAVANYTHNYLPKR
jgi:hypothetical protein